MNTCNQEVEVRGYDGYYSTEKCGGEMEEKHTFYDVTKPLQPLIRLSQCRTCRNVEMNLL